jgi:uncharacterized protein YydD (DUF2326 family)
MIIHRLYSDGDALFKPIKFESGFNVILGERSENSLKRNGVGKTISIEFLNFMLLNDMSRSRLKKIPQEVYKKRSIMFLDIEICGEFLTIKRDLDYPNEVNILNQGVSHYLSIDDARKFLLSKFNFKSPNLYCSFRNLIHPLTRDERCEFKSIPKYSDTNIDVPIDYNSHMFYLGIDNESLNSAMHIKEAINSETTVKRKVQRQVETLSGRSIDESRVELNKLRKEQNDVSSLVNSKDYSVFDTLDEKFQTINHELKSIRSEISSKKLKVKQAKSLVANQSVDIDVVNTIYSKIRASLASELTKSISEVVEFKKTIESYTNNIITGKISDINSEVKALQERRAFLLTERENFSSSAVDVEYDMKEAIGRLAILDKLIIELESYLSRVDELDTSIKRQKIELEQEKLNIELELQEYSMIIKSFEEKVLTIHKAIFDDYSASFDISVNNRKEVVSFDMRIKEDGGHSNERGKVFIYDFSLLLHDKQYSNHLGFLVHDNIFDNDNDTLQKSLNFIEKELASSSDKQYILTLNSDKLDSLHLDFNIDEYTRAEFSKTNKFLNETYKEI